METVKVELLELENKKIRISGSVQNCALVEDFLYFCILSDESIDCLFG